METSTTKNRFLRQLQLACIGGGVLHKHMHTKQYSLAISLYLHASQSPNVPLIPNVRVDTSHGSYRVHKSNQVQ